MTRGTWSILCSKLNVTPKQVEQAVSALSEEQLKLVVAVKQTPALVKLGLVTADGVAEINDWYDLTIAEESFLRNVSVAQKAWTRSLELGRDVDEINDLTFDHFPAKPLQDERNAVFVSSHGARALVPEEGKPSFLPRFVDVLTSSPAFRERLAKDLNLSVGCASDYLRVLPIYWAGTPHVIRVDVAANTKTSRWKKKFFVQLFVNKENHVYVTPFHDQRNAIPADNESVVIHDDRFHLVVDAAALCKRASSSEEGRAEVTCTDLYSHRMHKVCDRKEAVETSNRASSPVVETITSPKTPKGPPPSSSKGGRGRGRPGILGYLFTDFILPFLKVSVSVIIIMPLNTNDTFDSYKELQDAVDLYEKENRVQFWKRDAKTITSAKHHALNLYKTVQDKELDLKYYYIKYACIHGGQPFRPKNKQSSIKNCRNHDGTYKQDCNASITVGLKDRMLILGYLFTDFILPFLKVSVSVIIIMPLNTNDTFDSYKELQDAVDLYEKENRVQFWKRDAKTITSAKHHALNLYKTVQDKELDLKYYYIKYACIHGGQPFRPKNKQSSIKNCRNHDGTYKQDCNASITVGLKDRMLQLANSENIIDAPVAHSQNDEQVVVSTSIENYEIPNNYDEPDQQLANSENIIDAPVAHSQNDEQVVVSTSIENYEIPNNYDEPDQQLANSENIMNAPVETNEVQGNKDTQTQAQQLENEKQEQDSLENIYLPAPIKCRGRPRGKNTTAIGLPAKKKKRTK
ncbi:hypothetical protein FQA39_LY16092 [Lamprigera yunnana]|nr:hypothetical protein FQA39_LY16092 [Lamprigera yunnana]